MKSVELDQLPLVDTCDISIEFSIHMYAKCMNLTVGSVFRMELHTKFDQNEYI
jgi:hypothetical protein